MKKILSIILGVGIFIGIIAIVMLLEKLKKPADLPIVPTTPTQTEKQKEQTQKSAPVKYEKASTDKLLQLVNTRPTPSSTNDATIRTSIVEALGGKSGILYTSLNVTLEYVKTPNDFEGEIKTENISAAKQEAEIWLKNKGLTNDGICKLPLFFYLNRETAQKLKGSNIKFNPLPNGC